MLVKKTSNFCCVWQSVGTLLTLISVLGTSFVVFDVQCGFTVPSLSTRQEGEFAL